MLDWIAATGERFNLDALTCAGNLESLKSLQGDARHVFVKGDICDRAPPSACSPSTARAP